MPRRQWAAPVRSPGQSGRQGQRIRLVKNKDYWASGKPYLDEVVVNIMRDAQAMVVALEADALDLVDGPSIPDMTRLTKDGRYKAFTTPWTTTLIGFNTTREPTSNKALRQAFQYAVDRKRICDDHFLGQRHARSATVGDEFAGVRRREEQRLRVRPGEGQVVAVAGWRVESGLRSGRQYWPGQSGGQQPGPALPDTVWRRSASP